MELATIVPMKNLDAIEYDRTVMALSYLVDDYPEYRNFMIRRSLHGAFIMLDNSVIELKHPEPIEKLVVDATWIGAHEIVLPDVSRNLQATTRATTHAISYIHSQFPHGAPFRTLAAPQGDTKKAWLECAETFVDLGVDTIGISYLYNPLFGSRLNMINAILPLLDLERISVHLLGSHQNPNEVHEIVKSFPFVRSMDTASAAIYTKYGMKLADGQPRPGRDIDFANDELNRELLKENIEWWRRNCLNQNV